MIHIELPENKNMIGIVQGCTFHNLPQGFERVQDLFAELKKKFRRYRNLSDELCKDALILREAILRGELPCAQPKHKFGQVNEIHYTFFRDLFDHFRGIAGASQTMKFEHFVIGVSRNPINPADIQLGSEMFRRAPDTVIDDDGGTTYATTLLSETQGNPTLNTSVTSATVSSVTVASVAGAVPNGQIQIVTAKNTYYATVSSIVGLTLNLTDIIDLGGRLYTAFDLTDVPQAGDLVDGVHCEAGITSRTDSTSTPGTGRLFARRLYTFAKRTGTNAESVLYDYVFSFYSVR